MLFPCLSLHILFIAFIYRTVKIFLLSVPIADEAVLVFEEAVLVMVMDFRGKSTKNEQRAKLL
jgi:hypothetical protein